jgi:hypothetical protein
MRRLSERAANSCADARKPKCRCRCGGALHGSHAHGRTTEEIVAELDRLDVSFGLSEKASAALERLKQTLEVERQAPLFARGGV